MTKIRNDKALREIGVLVREERIRQGLSQYKLSYASDVPRSQIIRIENGEVNTTVSSIIAIAKALKVHPKELLDIAI